MAEPTVDIKLALEMGLLEEEYNLVCEKIGRTPTFTELGIVSVMWSEHCCYKNSIEYLKKLPKDGKKILSKAGEENAGVIDIGEGLAVSFKIESHNHPSAIDPYAGSATGVGGCLRDIFTMGAKPIATLNSLRFGDVSDEHVKYLVREAFKGMADYGNEMGIPCMGGEIYFEQEYMGNPLINAMSIGVCEHKHLMSASAKGVGNDVVYVGRKTGRDGIHGSSFASKEFDENTKAEEISVPKGDAKAEKDLLEASLEAIKKGLVVGIQDMGAAGLTCTSSEMSAKAGTGIEIDVSLVPLVEPDMSAYEIMLSESQERMLMIVEPKNLEVIKEIFASRDLCVVRLGKVTDDEKLRVFFHGELKAELPSEFLVLGGGAPVYHRETAEPKYLTQARTYTPDNFPVPSDFCKILEDLVRRPNIASKRALYEQFKGDIAIKSGGDAGLIKIEDTKKGLAASVDCNGRYCYLDAYEGTKGAVAEAARNVACTGASPVAITNNLNFGNPYKPEVYYTFVQAINGMKDACIAFDTPVTGGNVSFYNENPKGAIFPTPVIGMVGLIDDINKAVTIGFKKEGDLIYLLGDNCSEIGGSEYQMLIEQKPAGIPPSVDLEKEKKLQQTILDLIDKQIVNSAHDCSDGGLAVAICECCFPNNIGCEIDLPFKYRPDFELFGETHGRIIVSIDPSQKESFVTVCKVHNQSFLPLGKTVGNHIKVN
ncbi:MAG: phosphoribosylformylglycinamidine synthase subunit PurL, partial [Candidatus Cloacimonetes bacterium]|nr:phosphoribosylformylglycinamidine synthase subunit PurL [Candidatus Cloacimonadota bacterium]